MAYTYEFKQPDGSYQTRTVESDMSNTAGYLNSNIRAVQTVTPQAVTPATPTPIVTPVTPVTPTTPTATQTATPTTPTPVVPTNKRIKINNPLALAQGTTLTANDIVREGNDIYLKAGVAIPKGMESYFSQVDSPIINGATASNILPQNTVQNISGDMTEQQLILDKKTKAQSVIESFFNQDNTADNEAIVKAKNELTDLKSKIQAIQDKYNEAIINEDSTTNLTSVTSRKANTAIKQMNIELAPLLRQQDAMVEQVNTLVSSLQQKAADSRANAQLAMKYDANLTNELNNIQEQVRQGKVDELNILTTMLQMPEGVTYTMKDGTMLTGKKVGDMEVRYETDNYGNLTIMSVNKDLASKALANNKPVPWQIQTIPGVGKVETTGFETPTVKDINGISQQWNSQTGKWEDIPMSILDKISKYGLERTYRNLNSVSQLLPLVNYNTTGFYGILSSKISGTPAADFAAKLDTLKANITFGELTAMREASKTGGALGQVSDKEGELLGNALGALSIKQSPKAMKEGLEQVRSSIYNWYEALLKPEFDKIGYRESYQEAVEKYGIQGIVTFIKNNTKDTTSSFNSDPSSVSLNGSGMRTDRHNNPTAFTTDVAKIAGLKKGIDYVAGDPFPNNPNFKTAKLLGNPVATTINVIDKIGFYTQSGKQRWTHTAMTKQQWNNLSYEQKKSVIAQMYKKEGNQGLLNNYFV